MDNATANSVLKMFKVKHPKRYPTVIYKVSDGYVLEAPKYKNEVDYSNPYFYVSNDLKNVEPFKMNSFKELFEVLRTTPIWIRSE
jgi:hypothetical protein